MANHSHIRLKEPITPEEVEKVVGEINQRRFEGRLQLWSPEGMTEAWNAERAWMVQAPNSRPKTKDDLFTPDENLGFSFWLQKGGKAIETRHGVHNQWMRWIMYIHEHELAQHFGVVRFNGGDGTVATRPQQYQTNFYEYAILNFSKPLSDRDKAFINRYFFASVPEDWRWTIGGPPE